jgi:hypothetical protein
VSYWSEKLGMSHDQLRSAVAKAGPTVRKRRGELRGLTGENHAKTYY